jgi:hypothetical protein
MQAKYEKLMEKLDKLSGAVSTFFNGGKSTVKDSKENPLTVFADYGTLNSQITKEREALIVDAKKLGFVSG